MKIIFLRNAATALLFASLLALPAHSAAIYDSLPAVLPPNTPSLGYQATQTSEFGELIAFTGTARSLDSITLLMSDWALAADYGSLSPTWDQLLTLNLYNVDNSGGTPQPGSVIATRTQTFAIPWRPAADPTCAGGTAWRASDGNCYNGLAFTVTFDFTGTTVPDQLIFGLAFNTNTWGYSPVGKPGPYESLNLGLVTTGPSAGSDPNLGSAYWNTATAADYSDRGAGGVGTFRMDTNWSPYTGGARFETTATASPESGTGLLLGIALLAAPWMARRRA